jgi:hypothetical protein
METKNELLYFTLINNWLFTWLIFHSICVKSKDQSPWVWKQSFKAFKFPLKFIKTSIIPPGSWCPFPTFKCLWFSWDLPLGVEQHRFSICFCVFYRHWDVYCICYVTWSIHLKMALNWESWMPSSHYLNLIKNMIFFMTYCVCIL